MKKIVVANWKMHPNTLQEAEDLFRVSTGAIVCPPSIYLEGLSKISSGAELGAQDIALSDSPLHSNLSSGGEPGQTGEVTGEQMVRLGVKYVIIGHSERRWKLGESAETVNRKLKLALTHNFTPIVCIGEKVRDENFKEFLKEQVAATFAGLSAGEISRCLIAYEPVWSISTTPGAKADTPDSAIESIGIISQILSSKLPYLYGGSVDSENVAGFISRPEFSGILVGGASLDKEEFSKILEIASNV